MKKWIVLFLALAMLLSMAACGQAEPEVPEETEPTNPPTMAPAPVVNKVIHLLVPEAMTGWSAAAAANAKAKADTLNAEGNLTVNLQTYVTAEDQRKLLEDIAAQSPGDGSVGVALMPMGEEIAPALEKLLQANVAYALADTVPEGSGAASVANVQYDQLQLGAAAAAYLTEKGLTQKDKVVIIQGISDADARKTEGFKLYLQGKLEYNGKLIEKPWSSLKKIVYSDMQGTTQESAEAYFQTYMESKDHADTKYIAAWDDTYVLGVLEALEGANIDESIKKTFLDGKPVMTGLGASDAMYQQVITPNPSYASVASFEEIRTLVYSQNMLADALQAMADYFAGQVVVQDQLQPVGWAG